MRVEIEKGTAHGRVRIPPSKSAAHRLLLGAALAKGRSLLHGMAFSEDILATIDCICALGAKVLIDGDTVTVEGIGGKRIEREGLPLLPCRESGSTLRFLIPLAMLSGGGVFGGTERLVARGVGIYENLFDFADFTKEKNQITVRGSLKAGYYRVSGDVSSQFITGLLLALPMLDEDSMVEILPPFESRGYVDLTVAILQRFGVEIEKKGEFCFFVRGEVGYSPVEAEVEGDWSQAAFFYGLNVLGGEVEVDGLDAESVQGDRVCLEIYEKMRRGNLSADLSDCPDLAPVLFATACMGKGARFTGTRRLSIKESDRARVMAEELRKFGAEITVRENEVEVAPAELHMPREILSGHNDHRVVMALSVLATRFGAVIDGAEAIAKSYPSFFADMRNLGLKIREL
ncbi:MAG: 3-phosphoshikimate 1-carboxyvinyltransferase [Ruminococcaceae bacterium]|nr:3-phosphoshikimate 1-carboxyvinyltransferase [Oscillospiraceae bacterium]